MSTRIQLRGGATTSDPRLDRIEQFDERSRAYPIRALLAGSRPRRGRGWRCDPKLDQGREGACVGFAWTHELAAYPAVVRGVDDDYARRVYREAQRIDEWPGEAYEGTSVLAGAKVVMGLGGLSEYRWAFGIDDVIDTLAQFGPVVLGVPWLTGMFDADERGFIHATGTVAGGHAILARGVKLAGKEPVIRLRNSWGAGWGQSADCFITATDLDTLLRQGGEACVPVIRGKASAG